MRTFLKKNCEVTTGLHANILAEIKRAMTSQMPQNKYNGILKTTDQCFSSVIVITYDLIITSIS